MEYESFLQNNLRLKNLKERAFDTPEICVERARLGSSPDCGVNSPPSC